MATRYPAENIDPSLTESLITAVTSGNSIEVQNLLNRSADHSVKTDSRKTLLEFAIQKHQEAVTRKRMKTPPSWSRRFW